ncbi:MAG: tripartite tricarboxylate transporter substrate binding protein [Burkholderiaceae bacterium]|nr:tripartite tricarboxylate transporter substrate binding protein [Burkholderiaceae bacterium]
MIPNRFHPPSRRSALFGLAALFCASAAFAQAWPSRAITLIVPFPAGGFADNVTRPIAQEMSRSLGQQVIVDNRAGAGGKIGTEAIRRAPKDGYTIGLAVPATMSILPLVDPGFTNDPLRDFTPISLAVETYSTIVVNPSLKVRTLAEFIAYAKANPGKIAYGTPGAATSYHFHTGMFLDAAGIDALHVPYKGEAPAVTDLVSGQIQFMLVAGGAKQHIDGGRLVALATTGPKRWSVLPDTPTTAEAGLPAFQTLGWLGYIGPAGMPPDVVARLNAAFTAALKAPDVQQVLGTSGYMIRGGSPDDLAKAIRSDLDRFGKALKSGKIKLDK